MTEEDELNNMFNLPKEKSGENHDARLFDQYKIYLEMIDSLNNRRSNANNFFLSISTGLLSALGALFYTGVGINTNNVWIIMGSIGGMLFSYTWMRTVSSYRQLSNGKWKLVIEIEKKLPLSIHQTEWKILGEGKNKSLYKPITDVEKIVPVIFFLIFIGLIATSIAKFFVHF